MVQADVCEACALDRCQRFGHAVDKRLDADESGVRMSLGLGDQMLAAAKADLEPHIVGMLEKCSKICRRRICQIERKLRQQRLEQAGLMRRAASCLCAGRRRRARRRLVYRCMSECITAASLMRPFAKLNA